MTVAPRAQDGIALCLSGGGYRALLFNVGCLWRLNEFGMLPRIRMVSCVSGGAIAGGVLGMVWNSLEFDRRGIARRFEEELVRPIRRLTAETIDEWCFFGGAFSALSGADIMADALDQYLFERRTLKDLPEDQAGVGPCFIFNACNLHSGALFSFSRARVWDWQCGNFGGSNVRLAVAVTAAAAFVPMLSPLSFSDDPSASGAGTEGPRVASRRTAVLTDGGVLDPLALDPVWQNSRNVVVCDGGGSVPDALPKADWFQHTVDVLTLMHQQARRVQRTRVRNALVRADGSATSRSVAYCSIDDLLASDCQNEQRSVVGEPTRLSALSDSRQEALIGCGYAACDAACQRWPSAGMLSAHPDSCSVPTTAATAIADDIASEETPMTRGGARQ